jgi:GNAT superfamily N-acetyltransferase
MSELAEIRIRLARPGEREELEALQWRASLANKEDRPHLEANPDAIQLPVKQIEAGDVLVAELDSKIVGFSAILVEPDHVELDGLFVEPDRWRQGIGTNLVDAAVHVARRRGLTLMVVANPAALGFYERCGFTVEGGAETRFGPALRMSR